MTSTPTPSTHPNAKNVWFPFSLPIWILHLHKPQCLNSKSKNCSSFLTSPQPPSRPPAKLVGSTPQIPLLTISLLQSWPSLISTEARAPRWVCLHSPLPHDNCLMATECCFTSSAKSCRSSAVNPPNVFLARLEYKSSILTRISKSALNGPLPLFLLLCFHLEPPSPLPPNLIITAIFLVFKHHHACCALGFLYCLVFLPGMFFLLTSDGRLPFDFRPQLKCYLL